MKSRGYKSATAGILTALATAGAGAAGLYFGKKYMDETCTSSSNKLDTLINSFLNRSVTTPEFKISIPTNLPDDFPVSANFTVPNAGTFPVNTTAHIDLPAAVNVSLGPISDSYENIISYLIGKDGVDFLQSLSKETKKDCDSYVTPALLVIGVVTLVALLWQIAITFGFGSKLSAHDYRINKLKNEIKELKEQMNPQPLREVRSVTL